MKTIELEIQQRLEHRELGPVRIQWADGIIDAGVVVYCPHSEEGERHVALVPDSSCDDHVVCPQGHDIYLTHVEDKLTAYAEPPEGFSPPKLIRVWQSDVGKWPQVTHVREDTSE
ncbi:MAG: hypothetical protein A2785_01580 [Candidatus Chisholmbacteria bacterium RIFCSPHIGHO2_01_FULL_49_18]|uniref:Uncharacterized protein n=2 Tax=Candidatus Chisholmiibacteriota TaxID=1817900 RepID=A0A1G1VLK6_9BACT|nr:MAG: hypothetical protein A2785_01580 [Candidatus Chisholmbacteria bacterium RIFCSPHIGHO2_01_FULL_49_18]OGY21765.1 MAG: hypothetical protein A3A65_02240 [Candidatus Chisholmbacteria bacterium RIFCSPLOWO2_01_FULL_49_14]